LPIQDCHGFFFYPPPFTYLPTYLLFTYLPILLFRSMLGGLQFYKCTFLQVDKCELSSFQVDTWQVHMHIVTCTLACFQVHITHCHMHVAKFLGAHWHACKCTLYVTTPLWPSVGVKPNTPKVGDLESSGTPECLEFDSKAQNTLHWCVLGVIGKVLKRRYRKWPRIGHLDICSPSYGQKKGRESNWQFDFRPLKVGNRPRPDLRIESATRRWKDLDEGYNFGSDLVAIRLWNRELWALKVPGLEPGQFGDNFGTPTWESWEKEPFGCSPRGAL
jgi:hypothetical protein